MKFDHLLGYFVPAVMFLYGTYNIIKRYMEFPVSMTWYDIKTDNERMPYVQVCGQYWVDKHRLASWNVSWQQFEYMKRGFTGFNNYKGDTGTRLNASLEDQYRQFRNDHPHFDYRQFFAAVALQRKTLIPYCRWAEKRYDCDKIFKPLLTSSGFCWVMTPDLTPKQSVAGPIGGLRFLVYINQAYEPQKLLYNSGLDDGIHLSISGDWNPFLTNPIFVPKGKRAYIEVRNTRLQFVKDCTERRSLTHFPAYTRSGCLYECHVNVSLAECDCAAFTYNVSLDASRFCSPRLYRDCIFARHSDISRRVVTRCNKSCQKTCVTHEIESSVSYATTDTRKVQIYNRRKKKTKHNKWTADSTIMIHIYHSQIGHTLVQESQTMSVINALSNIGGLLCIWLGLNARLLAFVNWLKGRCGDEEIKTTTPV